MSDARAALNIDGVSHAYGAARVLHNVSLQVGAGEVHCLLGPSGSGKSTLLRLIAGLEDLQAGSITLAGQRVAHTPKGGSRRTMVPPEQRSIGFVFQDYALFPHLNVADNVRFGMSKPRRGEADLRRERAEKLLARVEMSGFARAMPHTLSGGQQQRVALARALARRPAVMLLDEPFSGLDDRLRIDVRDNTVAVLRAAQVATLIVTHDPQEALSLGDRISVVEEGHVLQTGSPRDLTERSISERVARVFGPVNTFPATVENGTVRLVLGSETSGSRAESENVTAMVRSEHLMLRGADQAPAEAAIDLGGGRIGDIKRSHGANEIRVQLQTSGEELLVIDAIHAPWRAGDSVAVSVLRERVMVATKEG